MADLIFDTLRYQIGTGFDWTTGSPFVVLVKKNGWTPAESDTFLADIFSAGATEVSTGDPGFTGTDRQFLTSLSVGTGAGSAFWLGDGISYPGIANAAAFDSAVVYFPGTSDADSWLMGYYDLGAQTGDGNPITVNPDANGYFQW